MKTRNLKHLTAEYRWAFEQTGDIERSLGHVFEVDRESHYRSTLAQENAVRAFVRGERLREFRRKAVGGRLDLIPRRMKVGEDIVAAVAARHHMSVGKFFLRSVSRAVSRIRAEAIWELRRSVEKFSYPECARFVGLVNHTTAIAAWRKHEERLTTNQTRVLGEGKAA